MTGCLKNIFALVGCGTLLLVGAVAGWQYRGELGSAYRHVTGGRRATDPVVTTGAASRHALESARKKENRFQRGKGPDAVMLTPAEMASLLRAAFPREAHHALDSVTVTLEPGRFTLGAGLRTSVFGQNALGRFQPLVREKERVEIGGPAEYLGDGIVRWVPDRLTLRSIPFPHAMVAGLVNQLTQRTDGSLLLKVPAAVQDMRIRPDGVIFYREIDR